MAKQEEERKHRTETARIPDEQQRGAAHNHRRVSNAAQIHEHALVISVVQLGRERALEERGQLVIPVEGLDSGIALPRDDN